MAIRGNHYALPCTNSHLQEYQTRRTELNFACRLWRRSASSLSNQLPSSGTRALTPWVNYPHGTPWVRRLHGYALVTALQFFSILEIRKLNYTPFSVCCLVEGHYEQGGFFAGFLKNDGAVVKKEFLMAFEVEWWQSNR